MRHRIKVDFVSDISCTWCAVGLANLNTALASLQGEVEPEISFEPFELDSTLPPGGENLIEHLERKYGMDRDGVEGVLARTRAAGDRAGFAFLLDDSTRTYNTFDIHRLLHWAKIQGKQKPLKEALLKAHLSEGRDTGSHDVMIEVAGEVGLSTSEARTVLEKGSYGEVVRQVEQKWLAAGITAVPAIILDDRYLLQGAQPPEAYISAFQKIIADRSEKAKNEAEAS